MPRIQQLPPLVVSKISAGEVIERPASVVKELLENAVDAGSRRIDVEVEQGGADLVRVVDNGCGIHPEDLLLAFASHATSKLRDADDLFQINTFGFRGEALPSIGGVAQVTLQSRPADLDCGSQITCHGGELSAVRPWNGTPGTRIEVRHLFYNTPVRRKFLRAPPTEMGHITEALTRLALSQCRPLREAGLHLTLKHNGKNIYDLPAATPLLDRITLLFGPEVSEALYRIEGQQGNIRLTGYIADPSCERGTARMQYLFVNGRWVRDRSLGHALQEAYRGLLMTGRYAVAFLFLELPPDQVDVNVHPTKSEVRFRDAQTLHHLLHGTVRERLRQEDLIARLQVPSTIRPTGEVEMLAGLGPFPSRSVTEPAPWDLTPPPAPPNDHLPLPSPGPPPAPVRPDPEVPPLFRQEQTAPPPAPDAVGSPAAQALALPALKVLQLYDTYLVMETEAGMLLIDQHALHERILFEQLKRRIRQGTLEVQRLLIPESVDLLADQAARLLEQKEALAELGLEVEDFGGNTVLVTGYPAMLGKRPPRDILQAVVDHLMTRERLPSREVLFNNLLSLMACHAAVRAGDRLSPDQMMALVEQRHLADDTHHCPHGRPTALLFSRQDLERQFGRI
jgi:DNA mismatch repair protein MutL